MTVGPHKSKALATWIAIVAGAFGLHRFYLHGVRDGWGWLYPVPTLLGLYGVRRMQLLGQDDRLAWVLIPLLGLTLASAMLSALVYALGSDDKWNARFNAGGRTSHGNWATVVGAIIALMLGAGVLMATIAFAAQRYFEVQVKTQARYTISRTGSG
jgi:hypothetical protein